MKDINIPALRNKLIKVYFAFIYLDMENAVNLAKKADGLWSGDFLLPKDIEVALNNLSAIYIEPVISKEKALEIYEKLNSNNK